MVACAMCGVVADAADGAGRDGRDAPGGGEAGPDPAADGAPLGWMVEREARTGRVTTVCGECARRYARSIEGKLDQAWW